MASTETRTGRGLALLRERGAEIREVAEGVYRVPSTTGRGYYRADLAAGTCECPDHEHRGALCLHLVAATVVEARQGCRRRRRTTTERPGRRHGSPGGNTPEYGRGSGPARRRGVSGGFDPAFVRANLRRMGG